MRCVALEELVRFDYENKMMNTKMFYLLSMACKIVLVNSKMYHGNKTGGIHRRIQTMTYVKLAHQCKTIYGKLSWFRCRMSILGRYQAATHTRAHVAHSTRMGKIVWAEDVHRSLWRRPSAIFRCIGNMSVFVSYYTRILTIVFCWCW